MKHFAILPKKRRSALPWPALAVGLAMGASALPRPALAAISCTDLAGGRLGTGVITAAQAIPAGAYTAPNGVVYPNLPAFCRVTATLTPTPKSDIRIELWMPSDVRQWNGRFVGTGNGGYAGAIVYPELAATLPLGFAVINTDMGTSPSTTLDGRPLTGYPQKQIDFGYRSTHLMTQAGKEIVEAFYGRKPEFSFFTGCSTGGGQALHEAEQFPNDYDGIVGGAPAENRTNLHVSILWQYAVTHATPQSLIPETLLQVALNSVLDECKLSSGSLPTDSFLTDPRSCHWNARKILCKPGQTAGCLTAAQADALNLIYDGPRDPRTGALIYPGVNRGSESGGLFDLAFEEGLVTNSTEPTFDGLFYWVFGSNWDWRTFDYDRDVAYLDQHLGTVANANSTDLSAFKSHGGKFLAYHGWADPLVPPQDDINYFLRLAARYDEPHAQGHRGTDVGSSDDYRQTQQFFRLFMAPGMSHCLGGPGPNVFGGADNPGGPADADHNVLLALQSWVETGHAPERIIATKYPLDDQTKPPVMSRPLCVFPQVASYEGSGDTSDAASFKCVESLSTANPTAAPQYTK